MRLDIKDDEVIKICLSCGKIHQVKELNGIIEMSPTFITKCEEVSDGKEAT